MSHFEGNLRPVNKIFGSGHEQAADESEYKEDLGAMASPAYAPPARRCRLAHIFKARSPVPPASDNSLIIQIINELNIKLVADIVYQFFTFDFYYNLVILQSATFTFVYLLCLSKSDI